MNQEIVRWVPCALVTSLSESGETEATGGIKGQKEPQISYKCPQGPGNLLGVHSLNYTFPATK